MRRFKGIIPDQISFYGFWNIGLITSNKVAVATFEQGDNFHTAINHIVVEVRDKKLWRKVE